MSKPQTTSTIAASQDLHALTPQDVKYVQQQMAVHYKVGGLVAALMAFNVALAVFLPVSLTAHIWLGMLIATVQGSLVLWFFMHMANECSMIYKIVIGSFICAAIGILLTYLAWSNPIVWGKDPYKSGPHGIYNH